MVGRAGVMRTVPQPSTQLEGATSRAVADMQRTIAALGDSPLTREGSTQIRDVVTVIGGVQLTHGLGRPPVGWILTRIRGGFVSAREVTSTDTTITLAFTAAGVTVDVLVF